MEQGKQFIKKNTLNDIDLKRIVGLLETIQYGSVTIIVQDGKIMQIERNEKIRLK